MMKSEKGQFTDDELKRIDEADDLHIAPYREDGKTYGTPTWIWEVVVEGDLYVRAYNGVNSRWYKAAMKQKAGRIQAAGMTKEVSFEPVEEGMNHAVDEVYSKKYSGSPYLYSMVSDRARAATVKISPEKE